MSSTSRVSTLAASARGRPVGASRASRPTTRGAEVGEQAQGGVVGGEALGVAQDALADGEGAHAHGGDGEVGEVGVLGRAHDQPGCGGGQSRRCTPR